ncbi:ADP-heptose:LPS heptosyltransferase [Mucilaginibacter frigoritolerans]|uniref:ADP-heptose:LPS heptosyltransferase n=1 Tax=Mucilaginibacter frigoritolerans TaxID=652788 RepID=A0A562U2J5_9SPHI|nr:glycosyltransferase family 9 protein [Mucilaginibacter frigoritolerans]TWI99953.1 ADP-heptose:LPS heptosyltransferase [Mucilaginibacter frigoritolerans]
MVIKNRNLFRVCRLILLKLPLLFRFFAKFRDEQKRLLIIKTDAIGDYVLFRNYLEVVRQSDQFKDYEIDLLGNTLWKDIALTYDASFISNFYFCSPDKLYEAPVKLLKLAWQLYKNNYQVVLQPSFTRVFITDGLAAFTVAKQIIGFESDTEGIPAQYKKKTDKFYTSRLILQPNIYFEFERTRFFFQSVLNCSINLSGPSIPVRNEMKNGIVIFPGAGTVKRGWERERFLDLIKLIITNTQQPIYLAGGPAETLIGDYLTANLPTQNVENLIGKTSLPQLIELIGRASLVIANETSAIHIAVATKTKSICILGGGHFGRFAPYSDGFENAPVCLFEKMECYNCNWECKFTTLPNQPHPCISNVGFAKVQQASLQLLQA